MTVSQALTQNALDMARMASAVASVADELMSCDLPSVSDTPVCPSENKAMQLQ
jgi:hypothetical protein